VTAEPTAAFSSDPKERRTSEAQPVLYKAAAGARPIFRRRLSLNTLTDLIKENLKLLVLGPILAALVAFAVTSALPKWYTSVAYLALDEASARSADARMRSSPVLDKVLSEYNAPRSTLEGRRRFLEDNRRVSVAAGETQRTANLFRLEYSDKSPQIAQKVNTLFIEAWLESTKPKPDHRATLEAEIERTDTQAKSISGLIDRLQNDAPSLLAQSLQGELATPILSLITKRDQNLAQLITLRNSLNGITRDVIFGKPDLPEEPSWPRRGMITILAGLLSALLLLVFILVRRFWPALNS
jgi:uncharacterized protein involved in exopolysaccharide biosynthesis